MQSPEEEKLQQVRAVCLLYPRVPHLQSQPTADWKYLGKKCYLVVGAHYVVRTMMVVSIQTCTDFIFLPFPTTAMLLYWTVQIKSISINTESSSGQYYSRVWLWEYVAWVRWWMRSLEGTGLSTQARKSPRIGTGIVWERMKMSQELTSSSYWGE